MSRLVMRIPKMYTVGIFCTKTYAMSTFKDCLVFSSTYVSYSVNKSTFFYFPRWVKNMWNWQVKKSFFLLLFFIFLKLFNFLSDFNVNFAARRRIQIGIWNFPAINQIFFAYHHEIDCLCFDRRLSNHVYNLKAKSIVSGQCLAVSNTATEKLYTGTACSSWSRRACLACKVNLGATLSPKQDNQLSNLIKPVSIPPQAEKTTNNFYLLVRKVANVGAVNLNNKVTVVEASFIGTRGFFNLIG